MVKRIAGTMAIIAFALCLIAGIGADNTFATSVARALIAMLATLVVGLIVGAMAQRMLDENAAPPAGDAGGGGGSGKKPGNS